MAARAYFLTFSMALIVACASSRREAEPALASARAALAAGENSRAIEILVRALQELPADAPSMRVELLRLLVNACALTSDPEAGERAAQAGLDLAPMDPWLHYAHGTALQELGRYDEAIAAYGRAVELDHGHVKAFQWRGWVLAQLGRHEESVYDFTSALSILEAANERALASWGGDRNALMRWTLAARADSLEALGRFDAAHDDRARAEREL